MSGVEFSLQPARDAWRSFSDTFYAGATEIKKTMEEQAVYAHRVFKETTIQERDGKYVIKGPFAYTYTCTWRDLVFIGGIITSVIFTVAAFFTGHLILGTIFLLYTAIISLGAYYCSEWSKNLTSEQIHEKSRQLGIASLSMLQEIVKKHVEQLHSVGGTYDAQIAELQSLLARLDSEAARMGSHNSLMDEALDALEGIATSLPDQLNPFITRMGETLQGSREVLDHLRGQNRELQETNAAVKKENATYATLNKEARKTLEEINTQIAAQREVIDEFRAELEAYGQERKRLAAQVDRLGAGGNASASPSTGGPTSTGGGQTT